MRKSSAVIGWRARPPPSGNSVVPAWSKAPVTAPSPTADLDVAPPRPDAPGVPFPHVAEDAYDAELEAVARDRAGRASRVIGVIRAVTILASALLAFALRHDLRYAFASHSPTELSVDATPAQLDAASHGLVSMHGVPGGVGAVDYRRPASSGLYRLAPLVERPDVFVELRLPDGLDPTRFVPPTSLRGRLVPLDEGGVRFANARGILERATGKSAPAKAWLLEQGAEPSPRSPAALVALLALVVTAAQLGLFAFDLRRRAARPRSH